MPPWRNRLARSAVNRKVGGSSPPGGALFFTTLSLSPTGDENEEKASLQLDQWEPKLEMKGEKDRSQQDSNLQSSDP